MHFSGANSFNLLNLLSICLTYQVLHVNIVNASVLKAGQPADISVNEMFTPLGVLYMKSSFFQLIWPGTKWCGDGDIAANVDDLGAFSATDMCCRAHDFCEDILFAGEMKETLINTHKYTRLHCNCDYQFYTCLVKVKKDRISAQLIGISYFDVLAPKCYSFLPPATCAKYESTLGLNKRCVKYNYDCSLGPRWQWFDVPKWAI